MAASILPATWDVPPEFRHRLGIHPGRQRHMVADGHLLLILHAPPEPDDEQRVGRFFWRTPDGTWTSKEFGTGANAVSTHLDQYDDLISKLDRQEDHADTANEHFQILDRLAPVYRAAHNMHRVFQEARKTCPEYRELINFRDRAYDIERKAELLFNGTKTALDYAVAKQVEEQAASSHSMAVAAHRLNTLAAFFFPIAALSSVFGVNLQSGFESQPPPTAFMALIAVGLLLGGLLTVFVMRPAPRAPSSKN